MEIGDIIEEDNRKVKGGKIEKKRKRRDCAATLSGLGGPNRSIKLQPAELSG